MKTNEDLTKNTLALIILEEERHKKNLLPLNFMYQLIKYGGSRSREVFKVSSRRIRRAPGGPAGGAKADEGLGRPLAAGKERREAQASGETDQEAVFKEELKQLKRKMQELELRLKKKD